MLRFINGIPGKAGLHSGIAFRMLSVGIVLLVQFPPGSKIQRFRFLQCTGPGGNHQRTVQAHRDIRRKGCSMLHFHKITGGKDLKPTATAVTGQLVPRLGHAAILAPQQAGLYDQGRHSESDLNGCHDDILLIVGNHRPHIHFQVPEFKIQLGAAAVIGSGAGEYLFLMLLMSAHQAFTQGVAVAVFLDTQIDGKTLRQMGIGQNISCIPGVPSNIGSLFQQLIVHNRSSANQFAHQ